MPKVPGVKDLDFFSSLFSAGDPVNIQLSSKYMDDLIMAKDELKSKLVKFPGVFDVKDKSNLEEKYNQIKQSISNTGFENTASLYSISDTAKIGGNLGWINENSLSAKINNALSGLKLNDHSKPITLPGGFLILQISDIKIIKEKLDINKELEKAINIETNRQLNQFSNIYFNKAKQEISIDEI